MGWVSDLISGGFDSLYTTLDEKTGGWGFLIPPLIFFGVMILLYFTVFRQYRNRLIGQYGYNPMGWSGKLLVVNYFIVFVGPTFFSELEQFSVFGIESDAQAVLKALALGLPGMIIVTIHCIVKTKNPVVVLVNIPIMFIVAFVMAFLIVMVVILWLALHFLKGMLTPGKYKCSACGARVSGGASSCYRCGASF